MSKKTVILGATTNTSRYAWLAATMLKEYGHEFVPVGLKEGDVLGNVILPISKKPTVNDVDTVTLYLGAQNQLAYYDYILSLKPKRVIFNPGTENPELANLVEGSGAEALEACTLVLLRSGQF